MSRDTWGGDVREPLSINKYAYAKENVINSTDPSGLCAVEGWQDASGLFTQANCNSLENDYMNGTTSFTASWYQQLAVRERTDGYVQAPDALEYFLQGAGGERQLSSSFTQDIIQVAMPEIQDEIDELVEWYNKKKFAGLANCNSLTVGPDIYFGGYFEPDFLAIGFGFKDKQLEVAATLGEFAVYVELSGTLDKVPFLWTYNVNSQLNVHVVILDVYNWNPGAYVFYPPSIFGGNRIEDNWGDNLEQNGSAKSYINRGDYTYTDTQTVWGSGSNPKPPGDWNAVSCIGEGFDTQNAAPGNKDYCGNPIR